jgi:hypothetical protein
MFMDRRGQAAAFDMVLALLAFTVSIAIISGYQSDAAQRAQAASVREDYTESLLLSMLHSTVGSDPAFRGMTLSDMTALFFQNQSLNHTLSAQVTEHMLPYTEERGIEWVVYANKSAVLWVPYNRILSGGEITSASADIPTADNGSVRFYLFLRWD